MSRGLASALVSIVALVGMLVCSFKAIARMIAEANQPHPSTASLLWAGAGGACLMAGWLAIRFITRDRPGEGDSEPQPGAPR